VAKITGTQLVVVGTVATAAMMQLIDTSIVNVSLSQMMGNLGATLEDISWVITAYAVANVIVIALSGWLAQRVGRSRYFLASIVMFTAASFLCGISNSVWELVVFRFLQGMAGGGIMTTAQAILVESFDREDLPIANAIFGMTVVIGPAMGPTLGGWITDNLNWNWIFFVNIPVGVVATILAKLYLPSAAHDPPPKGSMDWQGILFLVAGIGGLQVVLERGQDEGWFESGWIVFLSVVAAVSVVAFIWREWTAPHPVVHLRLLRVRSYGVGVFFSFIQGLGLYASMFLVPVFTQGILGMTAMDTGLLLLPSSILTALSMPAIGKIMQRGVSARMLAGLGFLLFFVFTVMLGRLNGQVGASDFFWPLVVRGIGMGMLFIPLTTLALGQLSGREIPQGTAMTNMVRQLGGSVGIALVASFVDRRMTFHRSVLAEHVVNTSPATWGRLQSAGAMFMSHGDTRWEAQRKALGMITGAVAREAAVMSYLDAFRVVGFFFVVSVPFVLLFKKPSMKIDPASMSME